MKIALSVVAMLLATVPASSVEVVGATNPLNIRAGPRPFHPLVASVAVGEPLELLGCIQDSSWCSVRTGEKWGWVDGDFLDVDPGDATRTVNSDRLGLKVPVVVYDEKVPEFAGATVAGAVVPGPVGAIVADPQSDRPAEGAVVLIPSDHGRPVDLVGTPPPDGGLPETVTDRMDPGYDEGTTSSVAEPVTPPPAGQPEP